MSLPRRWLRAALLLLALVPVAEPSAARADPGDVDVAHAARASVVRVRWRDARFSRMSVVRNAIVLRADGLLLMAGPPLGAGGTFTARLADGRELPAELVAADTQTTLTVLRVRAAGLRPLALRSEPVAALSDPSTAPRQAPLRYPALGLRVVMVTGDGSVAAGALRAQRHRGAVVDPETRRPQRTTGLLGAALAAVDEDAGSPLLDAQGRVVGLVVGRRAVLDPEEGQAAAGLGLKLRPEPREVLAVPACVAALAWPLLALHRRIPRAALGVRTLEMDDALRAQLDLDCGGHVVRSIEPDSPAAQAALELHDVIVAVDGRPIPVGASMHDVLLPYRPGATLELGIYRAGDRVQARLTVTERR